ncbi:MAG: ABC transporter permease [Bradyrhizobiaceae bacterium]|nr:ABC transporter permease [Bradyrhizobiaceae bacterium]
MAIARADGSLAAPAPAGRKIGLLRYPGVSRLAVVLALLGVWEITARLFVDREFLSPPSVVFTSLGELVGTPGVLDALWLTLYELTIAFALSVVIGVGVGLVIGLSRFAHKSFMPIVLLLYGIPQITILPIFVLLFGIGAPCKIAFGVSHGIFPVLIAVAAGVQNLKPVLLVSARSMGANRWQIFRYVIFPHMVPSFFAGMRLGMTAVLLGVLLAELYGSTAGIGYFTSVFTQNLDSTKLLGLVSVLASMAIVLNEIVRRVELHHSRWRT